MKSFCYKIKTAAFWNNKKSAQSIINFDLCSNCYHTPLKIDFYNYLDTIFLEIPSFLYISRCKIIYYHSLYKNNIFCSLLIVKLFLLFDTKVCDSLLSSYQYKPFGLSFHYGTSARFFQHSIWFFTMTTLWYFI